MESNSNKQAVTISNEELADLATSNIFGMTPYQTRYFVVGSQLTQYKQVRQSMMELKVRQESYDLVKIQRRKTIVKKKLIERDIENEHDELKQELLQCDLDETLRDIRMYDLKINQCTKEIEEFSGYIRELLPPGTTIENVETMLEDNPVEERKYWIARMAKQVAMDMVAYGNIGTGNMESVMHMSPEDQLQTLSIAIEFTNRLRSNVDALGRDITNRIGQSRQMESALFIPDITKIDPELLGSSGALE